MTTNSEYRLNPKSLKIGFQLQRTDSAQKSANLGESPSVEKHPTTADLSTEQLQLSEEALAAAYRSENRAAALLGGVSLGVLTLVSWVASVPYLPLIGAAATALVVGCAFRDGTFTSRKA